MTTRETDFLVIGSGIAGLTTALSLAHHGNVIIITKSSEEACNSYRAQGGIAAAIGEGDSARLHLEDTLRTGVGHADGDSVEMLVQMGPEIISLLADWGTPFDRNETGYALAKEGSHSKPRVLHVTGDATGKGIIDSLLLKANQHPSISFVSHTMVVDLMMEDGECIGVYAADPDHGTTQYVAHYGVVLATGGCGQVYQYTTNDLVSTGDGLAMAYRAGAALTDMEFVQFHPTALHLDQNPMFLISEAVRGEGAVLVTEDEVPFMKKYSDWGDLAPRDIVSRAINQETTHGHRVYLDARQQKDSFASRFPTIFATCMEAGIDPRVDLIPVTTAAHFLMGGVKTDRTGRTTIPRLYACGEVACTGVHGANRLGSNSLLEGAVFARKVAQSLSSLSRKTFTTLQGADESLRLCNNKQNEDQWKQQIQQLMWKYAGITRTKDGMEQGLKELKSISLQLPSSCLESQNMLQVAQVILESALWREESRGGHFRSDYPETIEIWASRQYTVEEK
ncbi:L-aspartate oxidase [Shimazuella sp. AN120528]|uniref:L-aspartate oxidase n=1 Tax=Shimazuella soli TaxID=1892854 RepID=UPI001F0DEED3|nr:L-aspartate oxidase [Shimazuella soli]MCH5583463.1 L-aspartate oxidase [Shimazuella soli]